MDLDYQIDENQNIITPDTPDRWGQQIQIKLIYKNSQQEQNEEKKTMRKKNIFKIKEQQKKKKAFHTKKSQFLENQVREGDSFFTNQNTHIIEFESTTFSQFGSLNSFDFLSSNNNSDNETA